MKNKFKESIFSLHEKFNEKRRLIVLTNSINNKTGKQLKEESSNLMCKSALFARYNYMLLSKKQSTLDETAFPLKEFQPISLQKVTKLLGNTTQIGHYSDLILYLTSTPEVFAQIVYFMLLKPFESNPDISEFTFSTDDNLYFCYVTFPAIYKFMLVSSYRQNALNLINNIFRLHIFLHDFQFSPSHIFISNLIFSYFLNTNPGRFFENAFKPSIPMLIVGIQFSDMRYLKESSMLSRKTYWRDIFFFVIELFGRMTQGIMLLPQSARELILMIGKIQGADYPINYVFIIDAMFCNYLRNFFLLEYSNLMNDVCTLIQCLYPQDKLPSKLYGEVSSIIDKKNNPIDDFLRAILIEEKSSDDGLSLGMQISKAETLLTPRDFNIIFKGCKHFAKYSENDKQAQFFNIYSKIEYLKSAVDDQYIQIKDYSTKDVLNKVDLNVTKPIDSFVDALNYINLQHIDFETPEELNSAIIKYCGSFLDLSQVCQIMTNQNLLLNGSQMLKTAKETHEKLRDNSDKLFTGLLFVSQEIEKRKKQINTYCNIFSQQTIIPLLIETFPSLFYYGPQDLLVPRESYTRFISNISKCTKYYNIDKESQDVIMKCFLLYFIDQIDFGINFQNRGRSMKKEISLSQYKDKKLDFYKKLSNHKMDMLNYAVMLFQKVLVTQRVSENMDLVVQAMRILEPFEDVYVNIAISMSCNKDIYGFLFFFKSYVVHDEVVKYVLNDEELHLLQRFQVVFESLK